VRPSGAASHLDLFQQSAFSVDGLVVLSLGEGRG
jgi:hypothetical protein